MEQSPMAESQVLPMGASLPKAALWEQRGTVVAGIGAAFVLGWVLHASYYNLAGHWAQERHLKGKVAQAQEISRQCLWWEP